MSGEDPEDDPAQMMPTIRGVLISKGHQARRPRPISTHRTSCGCTTCIEAGGADTVACLYRSESSKVHTLSRLLISVGLIPEALHHAGRI